MADTHSGMTSNMSVRPSIRYIRTVSLDEETSLCLLAGLWLGHCSLLWRD